jgi:hypothetical protein
MLLRPSTLLTEVPATLRLISETGRSPAALVAWLCEPSAWARRLTPSKPFAEMAVAGAYFGGARTLLFTAWRWFTLSALLP